MDGIHGLVFVGESSHIDRNVEHKDRSPILPTLYLFFYMFLDIFLLFFASLPGESL
jgi:hypothetical protein